MDSGPMPLVLDDDKLAAFVELGENGRAQTLHGKGPAEQAACLAECSLGSCGDCNT
jgi:hypothetical protein